MTTTTFASPFQNYSTEELPIAAMFDDLVAESQEIMRLMLTHAAKIEFLQQNTGKKFSKLVKESGLLLSELKRRIAVGQAATLLPPAIAENCTINQLIALGKPDMSGAIANLSPGDTMSDIEAAIKSERKAIKAGKPKKAPRKFFEWKKSKEGIRTANLEVPDVEVVRDIEQEIKAKEVNLIPPHTIFTDYFLYKQSHLELQALKDLELQVQSPAPNTADIVDAIEEVFEKDIVEKDIVEKDIVEKATVETPPESALQSPLPEVVQVALEELQHNKDRWKQGYSVGDRVFANSIVERFKEWARGEELVVTAVSGKVGTIQSIDVTRSDGQISDTFGNWVYSVPPTEEEAKVKFDALTAELARSCRELEQYQDKKNSPLVKSCRKQCAKEIEFAQQKLVNYAASVGMETEAASVILNMLPF